MLAGLTVLWGIGDDLGNLKGRLAAGGRVGRAGVVGELEKAVRAEVRAALRADRKRDGIALRNGRRVGGDGGRFEYEFDTPFEQSPFQRDEVLVRGPGAREWTAGEAVWGAHRKVRLTTEAALGERVAEVRVREDETAGLVPPRGQAEADRRRRQADRFRESGVDARRGTAIRRTGA